MITSFWQRLKRPGSFTRQVSSTFFLQTVSVAVVFISGVLVARRLGTEGKGVIQLVTLTVSMFTLFLSGGVGIANVYFIGKQRLSIASLTAASVTVTLLASLIGLVLMLALLGSGLAEKVLPGVSPLLLLLVLAMLPLELFRYFCLTILQGLQKFVLVNLLPLGYALVLLLATVWFLWVKSPGVVGATLAYLIAAAVGCAAATFFVWREGGVFWPRWDYPTLRLLLSYGIRGYVGNVLQFYNYRLDNFLVNYYVGVSGVGIYSVAVRLAELLWRFPDAVGYVIFPKAAATDHRTMNRLTPRVLLITLAITSVGSLIMAAVGKPFIIWVYTTEFAAAFVPLLWLLPGVIMMGAGKVLMSEIAGRGLPHYNSINSGLALILTIILDIWLIPIWGVVGAAAASSIAYTIVFIIALFMYWRVSREERVGSEP